MKATNVVIYTFFIVAVITLFMPFEFANITAYGLLGLSIMVSFFSHMYDRYQEDFTVSDLIVHGGSAFMALLPIGFIMALHISNMEVFKHSNRIPKLPTISFMVSMSILGLTAAFFQNVKIEYLAGISVFALILVYMIYQIVHYFITDDIYMKEEAPVLVAHD
jgi:hypothetical protein